MKGFWGFMIWLELGALVCDSKLAAQSRSWYVGVPRVGVCLAYP